MIFIFLGDAVAVTAFDGEAIFIFLDDAASL